MLTERKRKKVKKVAKALSKASKLHAGQAKTLRGVIGAKKKKRHLNISLKKINKII